jgi:hypothetical protein
LGICSVEVPVTNPADIASYMITENTKIAPLLELKNTDIKKATFFLKNIHGF